MPDLWLLNEVIKQVKANEGVDNFLNKPKNLLLQLTLEYVLKNKFVISNKEHEKI